MYMPGNITQTSTIEWNESDIGSVLGQTGLSGASGGLGDRLSSAIGTRFGVGVGEAAGSVTGLNTKDYLEMKRGAILNPYKEVLFKGIGHRTFQFSFKFTPRNERESIIVKKIIHKFRVNAAPTYTNLGENDRTDMAFLGYPNEFRIEFRKTGDYSRNTFIPQIAACALTNISVNYGPQGMYEGHADGSPTEIELSLDFKELELITRGKVQDGY